MYHNRKIKKLCAAICLGCVGVLPAFSQRMLSLEEVIALARKQSVEAAVALNELKAAYWEYHTYRADLLPEVSFTGTLPAYNKNYSRYQQSDGSYTFVKNNNMELDGELSVNQNVWLTGGTLSLTTSLSYIRQLDADKQKQFMNIPLSITFTQPLFGVNSLKWQRRIAPVRYREAKAEFLSATEEVTMKSLTYFFELLLAREQLNIAKQNLQNTEKLYTIADSKRSIGQISQNDWLQLRLSVLKAKAAMTDNESNLKAKMFQLRAFLGLDEGTEIEPVLPETVPDVEVSYGDVLEKALQNHSFSQNIRRRQLEADYAVAEAKGNLRKIDLYASLGLTGQDKQFRSVYHSSQWGNNQVVEVGVKIPILDWGKRRGKVRVAESERETVCAKIKQEQMDFNQDLFLLVEHFNNQAAQLGIANEADSIARRRYNANVQAFMIGQISMLDLNDAQSSKDEARQTRISELYNYWYYLYQIRSLTLWDYERKQELKEDFERVVR